MKREEGCESELKQFGNIELVKEDSRAMWTWAFWEQLAQDLRYGIRSMSANRLFTAMAALSLALGIGANTAIYSFMEAIFLRSLPVQDPASLAVLRWRVAGRSAVIHGVNGSMFGDGDHGRMSPNFPYAAFEQLREDKTVFSTLFAYNPAYELNLVARNQAEVARGMYVSGEFYSGLGVSPAAGRLIDVRDDRPGAPPVAMLSYDYWKSRFAADPSAIGQPIVVNNIPFTVVGVTQRGFFGVDTSGDPSVFLPLHAISTIAPKPADDEKRRFFNKQFYWVEMMGRLKPGVTLEMAQQRVASNFRSYVLATAGATEDKKVLPQLFLEPGALGLDSLRREYSKPLYVLIGMVGLILTIACANIANLLLARATARRREIAIRMSLGASRWRVVRQLLTESILLSVIGGALGLLVAQWAIRSIIWLLSTGREQVFRAELNLPVLGFTLALATLAGIVFGLAPALQATGMNVAPALKESRIAASTGRSRFSLSRLLIVSQIALSLLLVFAAGIFVRTLSNLHSVSTGLNRENILLFNLNARQGGYKDAALAQFYDSLRSRFAAIPGVREAGMSNYPLLAYNWDDESVTIPGAPAEKNGRPPSTAYLQVNAAFLRTMQIPITLGRDMNERDINSGKGVVVTEEFAKKFFPGMSPIGQHFGIGEKAQAADLEIVGVAKTTLYNNIKEKNTPPLAYVPYTHDLQGLGGVTFELRTAGDPLALSNTVRKIIHEASARVPVAKFRTQQAQIDETISQERTFANLCTCFALLALIIACIGLYGTMAYAVARRTSEIGVRMALGAERRRILWMVMREVLVLAAIGLSIGALVATETSHFVASFLFGVKPNDPASYAVSIAILAAAAIAAGYAPAWRASRIDPMSALRHE
ncbi:MAG TPA: ABC transporter permease [Bryobacteraceae bacterium]|nr:ABC transporter permease [Bryobacteraceae bacterium]